jgi:hypothetical protein
MDVREEFYVPVLCYVDKYKRDISGNIYPHHGFIYSSKFTNDINIQTGLYGILWGETTASIYEKINTGYWAVVKTEDNKSLIPVDKNNNRYKFRSGFVCYLGSFSGAGEFIWENRKMPYYLFNEHKNNIKREDIAGTVPWRKKYEKEWLELENLYCTDKHKIDKNSSIVKLTSRQRFRPKHFFA